MFTEICPVVLSTDVQVETFKNETVSEKVRRIEKQ